MLGKGRWHSRTAYVLLDGYHIGQREKGREIQDVPEPPLLFALFTAGEVGWV